MRTRGTQGSQVARLVRPISKTVGTQWYVDGVNGDDSDNGFSPETSFATIGQALSVAVYGDVITVGPAIYDEDGLDISNDGVKVCAEIGAQLTNSAAGTSEVLLVSGNYCCVSGLEVYDGLPKNRPGIKVTGYNTSLSDMACSASTVALDLDGSFCKVVRFRAAGYTTTGIDVSGIGNLLADCSVIGAGATRGVYLSAASADSNILRSVYSVNNGTASVEIVPGAIRNTVEDASFGAGDGRWIGVDGNVWSRIAYDDTVYHTTTFAGGGPAGENLFRVYGAVEIEYITGDVTVVLSADVDDIYLHLYDGVNSDLITSSLGGGVDTASAPVESLFLKTDDASAKLTLLASDQGRIFEQTSFVSPRVPFVANAASGVATYIRLEWDGVATSGEIHWHVKWRPLTEKGFVVPA
jgi:hypothetical protein